MIDRLHRHVLNFLFFAFLGALATVPYCGFGGVAGAALAAVWLWAFADALRHRPKLPRRHQRNCKGDHP